MNNVFTAKLLQNLQNKKGNKGFTLIELLVVVIIIGVLAAVALPNLLGQVGKARESEAKSALGALNRAQQAFHLEARIFLPGADATGSNVINGTDIWHKQNLHWVWYLVMTSTRSANTSDATGGANRTTVLVIAVATNPDNDGASDFGAAMNYATGTFDSTLCVAAIKQTVQLAHAGARSSRWYNAGQPNRYRNS